MSDETIPFPRPAGWQLSEVSVPECESVAGMQPSAASARILACMPDVHAVATIPISTPQSSGRDGRWLSAEMSAKLLLGAGALLVAVALVPALFRSKEPADEQAAAQPATSGQADEMPPLWTGIPDAGPKVNLPGTGPGGTAAHRAEGDSKPTSAVASKTAQTGPTEKTPDVSVWPDPRRTSTPEQPSQPRDAFLADQASPAPRTASLPRPYPSDSTWPASAETGATATAGGGGQFAAQANRAAALSTDRGYPDRSAASSAPSGANRPASSSDVPWYDPWTAPQVQPPAEPQYQARHQRPQSEPLQVPVQYQPSGYEPSQSRQAQYPSAQYQQSYREQPPYRETQYQAPAQQHAVQRPEDYPQYSRWESQPASYQAPSGQTSPPAQSWPPPSVPPASVTPSQQYSPQNWQPQPTQPQYQWDYTPDYRRAVVPGRTTPAGQSPDMQRQRPYGPQSYGPQSGAPRAYPPADRAPQSYAQQGSAQQWDERSRYEAQTYVSPQYCGQTAGYAAERVQTSAALVDRTMPIPPNEPGANASRYAYTDTSAGGGQGGRYDSRGAVEGEARLGTNSETVPARASYERAGPGTY